MPYRTILLFVLLIQLGCATPLSANNAAPETWLTVFVHGIMSIKPHLSVANFMRFMKDDDCFMHNSVYSGTVKRMRQDKVFFYNQAMQGFGLEEVDPTNLQKNNASTALAMVCEAMSKFAHAGKPVNNHYYTFGWSGLLSQKQRYIDACTLYNSLAQEVAKFRAQGIEPRIRVIGYSHGGNVCLNLAFARQNKVADAEVKVNELVLLGMPVQNETDFLINDPVFEKVYHIYSRGDRIQKLDFFSFNRFFSRRLFKERNDFALPEKLIQIQIKCTRTTTASRKQHRHQPNTSRAYNFKSPPMIGGKSHFLRDASPGHTELWFFGWTPLHYRQNFPLSPLPIVAVLPVILQVTKDFQEKSLFKKPTLIDIRPEHEIMLVKNQKSKRVLTIARFLSCNEMEKLKKIVLHYAPDNYTEAMYNGRIKMAYQQAFAESIAAGKHKKKSKHAYKKARKRHQH